MLQLPPEITRLQAIRSKVLSRRNKIKTQIHLDIGDDAFAFHPAGKLQVIAQDMMVEDVHFRTSYFTAYDLGWKSLAVNFSDLAAKGADVFAVQISLALPKNISDDWLSDFYDGALDLCEKYGAIVAGGDLCGSSDKTVIDVSVYGFADKVISRRGLQQNDLLLSSGPLGLSKKGFDILNQKSNSLDSQVYTNAHLRPNPRNDLVSFIQDHSKQIHCSIDVSDGLVSESLHLLRNAKDSQGWGIDFFTHDKDVLFGGEDYEILIAIAPEDLGLFTNWIKVGQVQNKNVLRHFTSPPNTNINLDPEWTTIHDLQIWSHF